MNESVIIILPLPPHVLSPNCAVATTGGRFAKAAAIKKYRLLSRSLVLQEFLMPESDDEKLTYPWKRASVTPIFYFPNNRRRDEDNAIASLKAAYDGIVDTGLLPDDDHKHMQRERPRFSIDKQHPRVELIIERLQ